MAVRLVGFSRARLVAVRAALALIWCRLARPPGPIPGDLQEFLQSILSGVRPEVTIVYGGADGVCAIPRARTAGYRILVCERGLIPRTHLPALLFHELIHVARGQELDAEAFESAWFSQAEGARLPTGDDWEIFKREAYQGWWVRLDPRSRRVTDYADRLVVTFPPPARRRSARRERRPSWPSPRERNRRSSA